MARGEPTQAEVLAFLDAAPGRRAADAVAHFAAQRRRIDGGKVRMWLSRRRHQPAPVAADVAVEVAETNGVQPKEAPALRLVMDEARERGSSAVPPAPKVARARAEPADRVMLTAADRLASLGPEMRAELRAFACGMTAMLARVGRLAGNGGPPDLNAEPIDYRQVAEVARALKTIVVDVAPGIGTFDTETAAPPAEGSIPTEPPAAIAARVAARMRDERARKATG